MASVALPSGRIGVLQLPQIGGGPAEDVVMIHGLGASTGFWYASAVQWYRRFGRVTLFDLPGHGDSDMPKSGYGPARLAGILGELLDHLQIDRASLVAHSFGGLVALSFAAQQPQRTKSLVLADVRLWAVEPPLSAVASALRLQRARGAGVQFTDTRFDLSIQVLVELAQRRVERADPRESEATVSEALPGACSLFQGERAARKFLRLIETTRAYDEITDPGGLSLAELGQVEQPMLAVYGGLSPRTRSALALQQYCSACQLHIIPDVGHFFPLTRPRLFARPVEAFLNSTARGQVEVRGRRRPESVWGDLPPPRDRAAHGVEPPTVAPDTDDPSGVMVRSSPERPGPHGRARPGHAGPDLTRENGPRSELASLSSPLAGAADPVPRAGTGRREVRRQV